MAAKYIVGIDLGTTNSALARCDASSAEEESRIEVRSIPQLVNPNEMAERTLLPSFLYIPGEFDFPKGSLALPWEPEPKLVIGELARKRGAESPSRLVASAKSWLSYAAVNRTAPILPWQAPEEVPSYRRSKRHRGFCSTYAPCGTAASHRSNSNSPLPNRTCCSLCLLRSMKRHAS